MSNSVEKSRISEKMFKSLFKSIHFPSYVWKIVENDLILIEYNISAEKITNGQIKNDLGRKASDIYKDQSKFYEGLYRCVNSQGNVFKEIKSICMTTGDEKFLSVNYSYIPPDLVLVHTEDITKKKKSEQILKREAEEKFRNLLETSSEGVIEIGVDPTIVSYVNPRFLEITGYDEQELINQKIMHKIIHPDDMKTLLITREEKKLEFRIYDKKKKLKWLSGERVNVYNPDGELIYIRIWVNDVTEKKRIEQKLKESEKKFRTITEQSLLGICIIQDNLIKYINQKFADLLGYTVEEVKNWKSGWFANVIHSEDRDWVMEQARKKQSGAKDVKHYYQYRLIKKTGEIIWLANFSRTILYMGRLANLVTVIDITERKHAEQKLKESEEQYRTMINYLDDPLHVVDKDLRILLINPAFERWLDDLGIEKDIRGRTVFEAFPFLSNKIRMDYEQVFDSGETQYIEGSTIINDREIITETIRIPIFKEGHVSQVLVITRDVTERKNTEKKIIESEEKYRLLAENINDIIIVIDDKFQVEYINEEVHKKILGTINNDVLGRNLLDLVHPDDKTIGLNSLLKGIKDKEGIIEIRVRHRKGHYLWFEAKGKAFLNNKGELKGILIARDITARKQAEEKLRESEERHRTLVETMTDGLAVIDENSCFTYLNISFYEMIGYSYDELLGTSIFNYLDKKNQSIVEEQLDKRREGEAQPYELVWTRKDGQKVYTIIAPKSLIDAEGNNIGSFAVITNITERIIAEQKLKESEEKYHTLFDGANDAIFLMVKEIFVECNKKTLEMFGCENEKDLIGVPPWVFSPTKQPDGRDSKEKALEYINNAFNGKPQRFYWKHSRKDGTTFDAEVSLNRIRIDDKYLIQAVVRDITEYLMAVQKLEESEETVKTLNDTFLEFTDDPLKNIQLLVNAAGKLLTSDCAAYNKLIDVNGKKILKTIAIWQEPPNFDREDNPIGHICTDIINMNSDDIAIIKDLDKTKYAKTDPNVQKYNLKQYCGIAVKLNNESVASFCVIYTKNRELSEVDKDIIRILAKSASIEEQRLYSYKKIKESEHKFKLIFDSIPDLFFLIDKDTTILDFKGRKEDLLIPPEKLINNKLRELIPRDIADLNYIATKKTLLTKQPQILEYELQIHDVNRHFEARHLYFSENQVAVFIREITARKKTEQSLRESEEKYRRLFENSPEAIMLTNIDGMVLDFNSAAEKIFGFGKNEVMGRYFYQFGIFDSAQIAIIKNRIMDLSLVKQKKFDEFKIKRKDSSSLWVLFQSSIVKLGNEPYVLSIAQDITEIKKAEKLIEKELIKLKELDEIKNELITRASHEFKTPLTLILGSAELFLKLYKGVYTDDMKQLIEIIYKGGKRLENLVKNTIDISLMESKNLSLRSEKEDIGKLINECVNDLIYLADKRELSLEVNVQENIFIPIDKNRITQVIKNIVSNAIKNTPPKGNISINLNRTNKHLQISIKDTGVGFTETEKQRLFKKFGKIERYGKDFDVDIEGPGLGLYLAKQIIEMHGGKIWVESEGINKGATFIIELPINL